jgi:3-hydroxyisobutyrate dehydrogenase-like beta-hydroxyacid dehydrogenase
MKITIVGIGAMGLAIGETILAAGHELTVYNRTPEKAQPLVDKGAVLTKSPAEAASRSEIVISLVTNPEAVDSVTLGPDGILAGLPSNSIHADMSTVLPESASALASKYAEAGKRFIQAPVLGSTPQIKAGKIIVVAGGDRAHIDRAEPAWKPFSSTIFKFDKPEEASTTKLAVNSMIAHMFIGLGQAMLFAKKGEVEPSRFLEIIQSTALASPVYAAKGGASILRDFSPTFTVANLLKDLRLLDSAAETLGVKLPANHNTQQYFDSAVANGFGDEDYCAVIKVLEEFMGSSLPA